MVDQSRETGVLSCPDEHRLRSTYEIELGDESWVTRVPDDANVLGFALRRDGEGVRVLHIAPLEVGKPMGLTLENLSGIEGAVTFRVTSEVVAITPLSADD